MSATLTSIFGAMSVILMDVPTTRSTSFVATDPRVHARYIMALASFTNCIAAILMAPIYTAITVQKVMSCTLNDVSATLQNFVGDAQSLASGGESSGNQLGLVISLADRFPVMYGQRSESSTRQCIGSGQFTRGPICRQSDSWIAPSSVLCGLWPRNNTVIAAGVTIF